MKKEIKMSFCPQEAKVVNATAVVKLKDGPKTASTVLKMSGIGKYPFVNIDKERIEFFFVYIL